MSIEDQLKKLTLNEATVLYWKCRGLRHKQIADRLGYGVDWVQLQMSQVYRKLGFDAKMHWSKRKEILEIEVCPRLPKNLNHRQFREENTEEIKQDPQITALVLYDEMKDEEDYMPSYPPPITIRPNPRPRPPIRGILFVIFLLAVAGLGGYLYGRFFPPQAPTTPPPATNPPVMPDTPLPSPTIPAGPTEPPFISSVVPIPTSATSTPESLLPTDTPVPTNTPFVPPADGILFQDNFDNGYKPDWNLGDNWIVSDGTLSQIAASSGEAYSWATLNRPEWKNYILSVKINIPYIGSAAQSDVAVAVRVNGQEKYLGIQILVAPGNALFFIGNTRFDSSAVANHRVFDFDSGSTIQIEANGNTFTVSVDGRQVQQVSLSGYDSGGIALGIQCRSTLGCPSFDDVNVSYLP